MQKSESASQEAAKISGLEVRTFVNIKVIRIDVKVKIQTTPIENQTEMCPEKSRLRRYRQSFISRSSNKCGTRIMFRFPR